MNMMEHGSGKIKIKLEPNESDKESPEDNVLGENWLHYEIKDELKEEDHVFENETETEINFGNNLQASNAPLDCRMSTRSRRKTTKAQENEAPTEPLTKKKSMAAAERMRLYRQRLKEKREYDFYKQKQIVYVAESRKNSSDEQKERTKELTRERVRKCREKKKAEGVPLNAPKTQTRATKEAQHEKNRERQRAYRNNMNAQKKENPLILICHEKENIEIKGFPKPEGIGTKFHRLEVHNGCEGGLENPKSCSQQTEQEATDEGIKVKTEFAGSESSTVKNPKESSPPSFILSHDWLPQKRHESSQQSLEGIATTLSQKKEGRNKHGRRKQRAASAELTGELNSAFIKCRQSTKTKLRGPLIASTLRCANSKMAKKKHRCEFCEKWFSTKQHLTVHVRTHTNEKPYRCEYCNKSFVQISNLTMHIRTHTKEKPFQCDLCGKSFSQKFVLTCHMQTHTNERLHQCDVCKKCFGQKSVLTRHKRTHTKEMAYKCELCDKKFTQKPNLTVHIRSHTNEKPYECEPCDKKFARKSSYVEHLRTHDDEKLHQCEFCEKTFTRKTNLTVHKRTHTNERPFQCVMCEKKFARKASLDEHVKTRTKEKPHHCKVCLKAFTQKANLRKHQKIHGPIVNNIDGMNLTVLPAIESTPLALVSKGPPAPATETVEMEPILKGPLFPMTNTMLQGPLPHIPKGPVFPTT